MSGMTPIKPLLVVVLLVSECCAYGADMSSAPSKTMKMDEPMPTKMAKPGMRQGDVKKAAEKKDREMKAMMDREVAGETRK